MAGRAEKYWTDGAEEYWADGAEEYCPFWPNPPSHTAPSAAGRGRSWKPASVDPLRDLFASRESEWDTYGENSQKTASDWADADKAPQNDAGPTIPHF